MQIKQAARKYAAEQGIAEKAALRMVAKSKEIFEKGAEVYANF